MLCYSTGSLPFGATPEQIVQWLLPTPFRGIEWVISPNDLKLTTDQSHWFGIRKTFEARGFRVSNIHLGFPRLLSESPHRPGLAALNPTSRSHRTEAALSAARIAHLLGSPHITVTSGLPEIVGGMPADAFCGPAFYERPPGARSPDFNLQCKTFEMELALLIRHKPASVAVLIEQEPEMVIHSTEQVLTLCQKFEGEVFSNLDVGHSAVICEDISKAILSLGRYLRNVHLEDIAGQKHQHLLFGQGDIDFTALFSSLRAQKYDGDLTPDLYPFSEDPEFALSASAQFLRRFGHY